MNKEHINNGDFLTLAAAHKFKFDIVRELNAVKQHNYVIVNEGNVILKMQRFALNDEFIGWAAFDRIAGVLYVSYSELYTGNEKISVKKDNSKHGILINCIKHLERPSGQLETLLPGIVVDSRAYKFITDMGYVSAALMDDTPITEEMVFDIFMNSIFLKYLPRNKGAAISKSIYHTMISYALTNVNERSVLEFGKTNDSLFVVIYHHLFDIEDNRRTVLIFENKYLEPGTENKNYHYTFEYEDIKNETNKIHFSESKASKIENGKNRKYEDKNVFNRMPYMGTFELRSLDREAVKTIVNKLGGMENGKNR